MKWNQWEKIYRKIEQDFSFSRDREVEARNMLSELIGESFIREEEIKKIIGKEVYVVGFSPKLEKEIESINSDFPVIAADEASIVLEQYGISPSIVMTDLDGDVEKMKEIEGVFGVHAHGDNIHLLPRVREFSRVFGTTQIEPVWNVYNFGGFTDGDRGVFLAAHFGAKIHLLGFDFSAPRFKEGKDMERKRKKLRWAKYLIEYLEGAGANIVWESLK